jgi:hypothetical protein
MWPGNVSLAGDNAAHHRGWLYRRGADKLPRRMRVSIVYLIVPEGSATSKARMPRVNQIRSDRRHLHRDDVQDCGKLESSLRLHMRNCRRSWRLRSATRGIDRFLFPSQTFACQRTPIIPQRLVSFARSSSTGRGSRYFGLSSYTRKRDRKRVFSECGRTDREWNWMAG